MLTPARAHTHSLAHFNHLRLQIAKEILIKNCCFWSSSLDSRTYSRLEMNCLSVCIMAMCFKFYFISFFAHMYVLFSALLQHAHTRTPQILYLFCFVFLSLFLFRVRFSLFIRVYTYVVCCCAPTKQRMYMYQLDFRCATHTHWTPIPMQHLRWYLFACVCVCVRQYSHGHTKIIRCVREWKNRCPNGHVRTFCTQFDFKCSRKSTNTNTNTMTKKYDVFFLSFFSVVVVVRDDCSYIYMYCVYGWTK